MTREYTPTDRELLKRAARHTLSSNGVHDAVDLAERAIYEMASDIAPEKIDWIWPGRLARGKITLLEGDPGLGKSVLTVEIAALLSRGWLLPNGKSLPPMGTLFLSAEDGKADTIVPRLIAAGADLSRIPIMDGVRAGNDEAPVAIPEGLPIIEALMRKTGCGLVVVDPLSVFLGEGINENKNQEVRKALAPAKAMLERARVAGLFLRHLTKSQSATPVYRGAGSIGLGGAARVVMMVAEDPEIPGLRVLANVKENLSVPQESLAYQIISNAENPDAAEVSWQGESKWRAQDLQVGPSPEENTKLADAKEWLGLYLNDGRAVKAKLVYKAAKDDNIKEHTLDRAKKALGVESTWDGIQRFWAWRLPIGSEGAEGAKGAKGASE